jgi:hypothetical protein
MIPAIIVGMVVFAMSIYSAEENFLKKGSEGGIAFLSGGIGQHEREILKKMGKDYSLKLIFSNRKSEYLSDVMVTVFNHKDEKILFTVSFGPWLFIDLPSGMFNLEASFQGGRKKVSQIRLEKGTQKVHAIQW